MNISYTRMTDQSAEDTKEKIINLAKEKGFIIKEPTELKEKRGYFVHLCKQQWVDEVLGKYPKLVGLMPCSILIRSTDKGTEVNIGSPTLMKAGGHMHDIEELLETIEKEMISLVHEGANVEPLKATGVKLYSTSTCPYCNQEKEYLEQKGIEFEYILVDKDQQKAEEMVKKTGQMGVPVTEIEFDEAEPEYIVGFDKQRINSLLGIDG